MPVRYDDNFSFYSQLQYYYNINRGKIRRNYKDITRKFLDYNDRSLNPKAYLRTPQFEALEMYVFIKEFMDNAQVHSMFEDWSNKRDKFADASYYSTERGQITMFDGLTKEQTRAVFKGMKDVSENYPNYIYALTMGLGKTHLMITCIFYEFLLANKYPKDKRFCHNAIIFAPDLTVLRTVIKDIVNFDKTKVIPEEYARVLDANIKFHFLDDSSTSLNTLDASDFNVIISNTQKIIVKKKNKESTAIDKLFKASSLLSDLYGEEDLENNGDLIFNQRFQKLCRLSQIGVYVDEAHHMFGNELKKSLRKNATQTSLRSTINLLADDLARHGTNVVACYNYTGTPYVNNQVLPEVVYAYGLRESIANDYLKEVDVQAYENVKNEEFLSAVIKDFWEKYGNKTYEGLSPKLAIFASRIEEAQNEVLPIVGRIISDLGISSLKILVNVGDASNDVIRDFNNLDVPNSGGNEKQFIILVGKGTEGWNCRSLFGVALFRNPHSTVFVLQATMRCLRKITDEQQTASVYLSKENFDTLNDELNRNFNIEIKDLKGSSGSKKVPYKVRVLPPPRCIKVKRIQHKYSLNEKGYTAPIDFALSELDLDKYKAVIYERDGLARDMSVKERDADSLKDNIKYSAFTLAAEISRYLNISPILVSKILSESKDATDTKDGIDTIVEYINKYNDILFDVIVPSIFKALFEVKCEIVTEDKDLILLKEPADAGYYEFKGLPELVVKNVDANVHKYAHKSFHADTYCFDSRPEKECFWQYIISNKVKEVYFTGMFTSNQGDLSIQYYDPESRRIRHYYPDFLAIMEDGSYQLIEVKGDNKIDDIVVKAKADAARELAVESNMEYIIYAGSRLMSSNVLDDTTPISSQTSIIAENL